MAGHSRRWSAAPRLSNPREAHWPLCARRTTRAAIALQFNARERSSNEWFQWKSGAATQAAPRALRPERLHGRPGQQLATGQRDGRRALQGRRRVEPGGASARTAQARQSSRRTTAGDAATDEARHHERSRSADRRSASPRAGLAPRAQDARVPTARTERRNSAASARCPDDARVASRSAVVSLSEVLAPAVRRLGQWFELAIGRGWCPSSEYFDATTARAGTSSVRPAASAAMIGANHDRPQPVRRAADRDGRRRRARYSAARSASAAHLVGGARPEPRSCAGFSAGGTSARRAPSRPAEVPLRLSSTRPGCSGERKAYPWGRGQR